MKANGCERLRTFSWMDESAAPERAPHGLLSACRTEGEALVIAMRMKPGGPFSAAWFAKKLAISPSYLSEIKKGEKPFPVRLRKPFAYLTGTWLLSQYHELQSALRAASGAETDSDRITRIMREAGVHIGNFLEKVV